MNKKIIAFTILTCAVLIAACEPSPKDGSNNKTGKELYTQWCTACHGAKGNMMFNGAKDLTVSTLSIRQRKKIITDGKGLMAPLGGNLSAEEIMRVAKYSATLNSDF